MVELFELFEHGTVKGSRFKTANVVVELFELELKKVQRLIEHCTFFIRLNLCNLWMNYFLFILLSISVASRLIFEKANHFLPRSFKEAPI